MFHERKRFVIIIRLKHNLSCDLLFNSIISSFKSLQFSIWWRQFVLMSRTRESKLDIQSVHTHKSSVHIQTESDCPFKIYHSLQFCVFKIFETKGNIYTCIVPHRELHYFI